MSASEFRIAVTDLDAGGKAFQFPVRPAWVRGALEDHEATAGDRDGERRRAASEALAKHERAGDDAAAGRRELPGGAGEGGLPGAGLRRARGHHLEHHAGVRAPGHRACGLRAGCGGD